MMILIIGLTCSILLLSSEGSGSCSDNFSGSVGSGSSSGALWVRKFGNLHIREILVVT